MTREWPYKNVKPRIIAEQLLETLDGSEIADYKVHNFNGIPRIILVCRDRFNGVMTEDFYDTQWNHIDVRRPAHPNAMHLEEQPKTLEKMLELSQRLSEGIPFVRNDFYSINGKVYFGEMTFYPASGLVPFVPESYDLMFGEWLNLSQINHR